MILLHISDTHLGKRQYNLDSREKDIYDAFQQLIEVAINEHVDAVIHTGDLFDVSDPPVRVIHEAYKYLKKLKEKNIPFISIPGDHDTPKRKGNIYPQFLLYELDLVKLLLDPLKPYVMNKGDVSLNIFGFRHFPNLAKDELLKLLNSLKTQPNRNIIMLHQGFKEVLPYEGAWQLSFANLPKGFNYYACGHIHTRYMHKNNDGSVVAIAGSPDIMREEEIEGYLKNKKGAYLVDISKQEPTIQLINTDIRPQEVVELDTRGIDSTINELIAKYRSYSKKPILHIVIKGEPIKRDLLYSKLQKLQEVTEHYRIYKDLTVMSKEDLKKLINNDVNNVNNINNLIINYLTKEYTYKFSEEDAKLVIELIENVDNDTKVEELIKKIAGV
ncbi:MAG: DNA double-strand break repair protein Mre11 [Sulfolobaceae archaeon]|nr:DNA double-strand break repair protein Mre11 [Sulfolobaceae archaeon]